MAPASSATGFPRISTLSPRSGTSRRTEEQESEYIFAKPTQGETGKQYSDPCFSCFCSCFCSARRQVHTRRARDLRAEQVHIVDPLLGFLGALAVAGAQRVHE